jgi:alpha-D-ribose 1-methylphosphonate 5-triphosphate synthase subunit PhnG
MEDTDYILCECELDVLEAFVSEIEKNYEVTVVRPPGICLAMIKAEDSVEHQKFFLGEALTTECELIVNGKTGHGIVIGDEPVRSYCVAFIDAVIQLDPEPLTAVKEFLSDQSALIGLRNKIEYNHILRTKVDFKLMDQD